jgi:mono/diheme cytochrome c family protein
MRPVKLTFVIAALAASALPALAQEPGGNVAHGRRLAEQWCSACHQLNAAGAPPRANSPGFAQIAAMPSTTALSLRVFLQTTHADMPSIEMTAAETDDLIAFILSLK